MGPPRGDYSASKGKLFDECPAAYAFRYLEHAKSPPTGAMRKGLALHQAFETVGRLVMAAGRVTVTEDELRAAFVAACARHHLNAAEIREAWTIAKDVRTKLDFTYTVAIEENFARELHGKKVVGVYDRVELKDGKWEALDYKSGQDVPSHDEAADDLQVCLYLVDLHERTGSDAVAVTLWFLPADRRVTVWWSRTLHDQTLARLKVAFEEVQAATTSGTFPAKTGTNCVTCFHQVRCPAYLALLKSPASVVAAAAAPDSELLKERQRCSTLAKLFEAHRKELDDAIRKRLVDKVTLVGSGVRARMVTRTQSKLPELEAVVAGLAAATGRPADVVRGAVLGLDPRKLKDWVADLAPDVRKVADEKLDELAVAYDAYSYVDIRELPSTPFVTQGI